MSNLLNGVAVITGAGSGIGQATAINFAQHGVKKFAFLDINTTGMAATIDLIAKVDPEIDVLPIKVDIADEVGVVKGIKEVVKRFGEINIAVNNAGGAGPIGPSTEMSLESYRRVLDVNVIGMWVAQREIIKQMLQQKPTLKGSDIGNRGVIVNMSSIYGLIAPSAATPACAYTTSKHGVIGMTKTDANCYAKDGIRINAICPGFVQTAAMRAGVEAGNAMDLELSKVPLGRFAQPEELANAILFLASPMSSYMSGSCLVVDGGYSCQ